MTNSKINFRASAIKETTLSPLMADRAKLSMEDVQKKFPDGVTITEFDFITVTKNGEAKTYPVMLFKEDSSAYINGGLVLSKICHGWAEAYDGDVAAASEDLKAEGGVKMKFHPGRTSGGNSITNVTIL